MKSLMKRHWTVRSLATIAVIFACAAVFYFQQEPRAQSTQNPIQLENARTGTSAWRLTNSARNREIEGYASASSINRGDQISFFVNTANPTTDPTFTLEIFRMGWYGGTGGRRMTQPVTLTTHVQPIPTPDPVTGLAECDWSFPFTVSTSSSDSTLWLSGFYLVKLTGASGKQSYIPFVIREDSRVSDLLFSVSMNTYHAYNAWGGKGLYTYNSTNNVAAVKVSFNRPLDEGLGSGQFLSYDFDMIGFLEQEGYDVVYQADLDTHLNPASLIQHKGFLSVGHDEYWTLEMRQNVIRARDQGVSLGFFGADAIYWQVRYEPSTVNAAPNRTMVGYKETAANDPAAQNPATYPQITTQFRMPHKTLPGQPEDATVGVMYDYQPVDSDIVIVNASHWVFAGTGLVNGSKLSGLLGYEVDREFGHQPAGTVVLAHSPYVTDSSATQFADMTIYQAASGAWVFGVGSIQFDWGLSSVSPWGPPSPRVNAAAQQIARNVLGQFLARPFPGPTPTATATPTATPTATGITATPTRTATGTPTPTSTSTPSPGRITLRSIGTGSTTAASNQVVVTTPSGAQPNDLMVAEIGVRGGTTTAITAPAGWTLVRRIDSGTDVAEAIYTRLVPSSPAEPSSYTWNFTAGNDAAGAIAAYIGVSAATPVDADSGQGNVSSTSITAPSATVPGGDNSDLLVGLFSIANSSVVTLPAGMTQRWSFHATGFGISVAAADLNLTSSGATGNKVAAAGSAAANIGALLALKPQSVQASPTPTSTPSTITLRGTGIGSTSAIDSKVVVNTPVGMQPNDLMIAEIAVRGGTVTTITPPAGWTLVRRDNSTTDLAQAIYRRLVPSSPPEPSTYTWTFTAGNDAAGGIAAYTGVSTAVPVDVNGGQSNASSTSITAPSVTIPAGDNSDLLIGMFSISSGAATVTVPSGMTQRWSFAASGFGIGIAAADLHLTSSGATGTKVASASAAANNVGALIALRP